jgi:oxygen-independent coproporphyrinogen-3 oxidase
MSLSCTTATRLRQLALLPSYGGRVPRYTSYPTAAQFTPEVDADVYGDWLGALPTDRPVSLYVHVPFCARLCWYCGCNTRVINHGESISEYVALLERELALVEARLPGRLAANAIHLGGGTPNMLRPADLATLFGALRRVFAVVPDAEIAAELDPSVLTREWVQAAARHGLSRASLGVQDLSPDVQAAVNRREPFEVVERAAGWLRSARVPSLNLDLMYGLPRQHTREVLATLDQVLTLKPERLALFGYAHVPWMKPHQKLIDERELAGEAERLAQSEAAAEKLESAGYVRIGLDHYALPDDPLAIAQAKGGLHRNFQGYTTDAAEALLGLGVSAIGRLPQGFVQNHAVEREWRAAVRAGRLPTARGVGLTEDDRVRAAIIERLMCDYEADFEALDRAFPGAARLAAEARRRLAQLERDGVAAWRGRTLAVSPEGRPFVRQVCAAFDAYLDPQTQRHSKAV